MYKIKIPECKLMLMDHLTQVVHRFFADWEEIATIHNIIGTYISILAIFVIAFIMTFRSML